MPIIIQQPQPMMQPPPWQKKGSDKRGRSRGRSPRDIPLHETLNNSSSFRGKNPQSFRADGRLADAAYFAVAATAKNCDRIENWLGDKIADYRQSDDG